MCEKERGRETECEKEMGVESSRQIVRKRWGEGRECVRKRGGRESV